MREVFGCAIQQDDGSFQECREVAGRFVPVLPVSEKEQAEWCQITWMVNDRRRRADRGLFWLLLCALLLFAVWCVWSVVIGNEIAQGAFVFIVAVVGVLLRYDLHKQNISRHANYLTTNFLEKIGSRRVRDAICIVDPDGCFGDIAPLYRFEDLALESDASRSTRLVLGSLLAGGCES